MSEREGRRTDYFMVKPEPKPSEGELQDLRQRLLAAARRSVPADEAEDVTQEALLRVVRDHPTGSAPPLIARARVKLRDARADYYRARKRIPRPVAVLPEADSERQRALLELVELEDLVRQIAGDDVFQFCSWKAEGMTDAEIAAQPQWSAQRAAAARKQHARKLPSIAAAVGYEKEET
jgi:DNA-directed RNA polymerase specialized sigma24 family protein